MQFVGQIHRRQHAGLKSRGRLKPAPHSLAVILALAAAVAAHGALMPLPWTLVQGDGALALGPGFSVVNHGCPESVLATSHLPQSVSGPALTISCARPAPEWPTLGEDESYTLDVTREGATLGAPTATGVLRGLQTLSQLAGSATEIPAVHIEDHPRYPWRGLMLDVARHWMPVAVVERNLDAMAAVKLNVLHWHLSDDQGFRVESRLYPQLQQFGSDGKYYTQDQIREVLAYARDRGIRIVPEFDMPGHTTSWFAGMPSLAAASGPYQIEINFGVFPNVMNQSADSTYSFLDAFLGEMAALFPDPYFHIGGDEVQDPAARALQPQFNLRVQSILRQHGKTLVGWDDVIAPGLATDAVAQVWHGTSVLASDSAKGYRSILSYGYYLDYLYPASQHYAVDPGSDPNTLGGEACMWGEYVSAQTVDSRIWPRTAAIAERFWSPANVTDVNSMYQRLEAVSRRLDVTGVQHRSGYLPMLVNLANGQRLEPLRILGDASEATGIQVRAKAQHYTSLTPLDRFVDAARPESDVVRHLQQAVAQLISGDPAAFRTLHLQFREWAGSGPVPVAELVPLSEGLRTVGEIGLAALQSWETNQPVTPDWVAQQNRTLDALSKPIAEVVLAAVRPVRLLIQGLKLTAARTEPRPARSWEKIQETAPSRSRLRWGRINTQVFPNPNPSFSDSR